MEPGGLGADANAHAGGDVDHDGGSHGSDDDAQCCYLVGGRHRW